MKTFLNVIGLLALLAAVGVAVVAKSAVHEIESGIFGVIAVTAMGFAALLEQRHKQAEEMLKKQEEVALVQRNFFSAARAWMERGPEERQG